MAGGLAAATSGPQTARGLRFVGIFALQFLVLIPCLLWVFPRVLPGYAEGIAGAANGVLARISDRQLEPREGGGWWGTVEASPTLQLLGASRVPVDEYSPGQIRSVLIGLAILPALVLATPLPWRRRLRLLALALGILWVAHVACVVGLVETERCLQAQPDDPLCHGLRGNLMSSGQLVATGLWIALTCRFWLGLREDPRS